MPIVSRPLFQLRSLPIAMRWEVTRRNPYYYAWWRLARAEHRREVIATPDDAVLREAAVGILAMIGVSGEPVDPATAFASLGAESLEQGWLSGAVHPVTLRGLAGILLAALPADALRQIGRTFLAAASDDVEGEKPKRIQALERLTASDAAGLDSIPDEPFVSINPAASERSIYAAIDQLLSEWKAGRSIDERRDRSDRHPEYLEVWDLREGWGDGIYDRRTEQTFREIGEMTKRSISTLCNQYDRAFELIVGRPYSRELWLGLFGPIKLSDLVGAGVARTRRPTASPSPRPVPDSVVTPPGAGTSSPVPSISGSQGCGDDLAYIQLLDDIKSMLDLGRSDQEICEELDLNLEVVAYLRQRGDLSSLRTRETS